MDRWLLSFILGAILSLFSPIVPVLFYQLLLFSLIFLFFFLKPYRNIIAFSLGFFLLLHHAADYHNIWQHNQLKSEHVFNSTVNVIGEVADIPELKNNTTRFMFRVKKINQQALTKPFLVRLRWDDIETKVRQGQQWQLDIRLKPAHGYANPAGFSYQTWLISQKIAATGYVIKHQNNCLLWEDVAIRSHL